MSGRTLLNITVAATLVVGLTTPSLVAQRGGSGGSRGGGGMSMMGASTRLGALTLVLKLDEAQKKAAKATLDGAFKAAAPLRTSLDAAREKLGAAVAAGDPSQIDAATAVYAEQATLMAKAEAQALARVVAGLTPEQAPAAAVQMAASYMRGAFVGKKWDAAPDVRFY